jgi:hypothetical protein
MLIMVAPAGLEQMLFECRAPLPDGLMAALPPSQPEIEKMLAVAPSRRARLGPWHTLRWVFASQ